MMRTRIGAIVLMATLAWADFATAAVYNLKVVTDASPDYSDVGSMIHSITANWPKTEQACWALWYWNHIARRQTTPIVLHGRALTDPIRQFNDYGFTMCSTISGINCGIWGAMGLHAKYWDIGSHTVPEVEYDGRFHMYDNSLTAIYTLCDGKTIAGVEEIGAEGACAASGGRSEPGHIAKYHCLAGTSANGFLAGCDTQRSLAEEYQCFNPNALKYRFYYNDWDLGHRYILNLRDGESYTRFYHRLDRETAGAVPQGDKHSNFQADPAYFVPNGSGGPDPEAANPRYRIRGNGVRHWTPGNSAQELVHRAESFRDVAAIAGGIAPTQARRKGEIVFKVEGANVITSLAIKATFFRKSDNDEATIAISTNNGVTWEDVRKTLRIGEFPAAVKIVEPVNGAYEVLVRVTLLGWANAADAQLRSIDFETITQVNSKTLPRLRLGKNTIYVGAGEQTESIVIWPNLENTSYKQYIVGENNIAQPAKQQGYLAYLCAEKGRKDAEVDFCIGAPRDVTSVTFGGRFYNRGSRAQIKLFHWFDSEETWQPSYSLTETSSPWDVIHYETIRDVPAGTRWVLLKYQFKSDDPGVGQCGLYAVRMEVNHKPIEAEFKPLDVTYTWKERQADNTTVERSHTQRVDKLPCTYEINVGGADHPVMESLRIESGHASSPSIKQGYSDGKDRNDSEKFQDRWVTYGKNLAEGKPYTCTVPSGTNWGANDGGGKILTDGIVGSPYTGGSAYQSGPMWSKGQRPVVTVDLGKVERCAAFRIHAGGYPWWDALKGEVKDQVEVQTSVDGQAYESQGRFDFHLRWKDIPANEAWPDEETLCAPNYVLAAAHPVDARFVRFVITPERMLSVTEVQVLDSIRYEPFDLKLAMPDGKDRSDMSRYNPPHFESAAREPGRSKKAISGGKSSKRTQKAATPKTPDSKASTAPVPAVGRAAQAGELIQEEPTLRCLGVRWFIGGDANRNARVAVAYRKPGDEAWKPALDLFRVETAAIREANRPPAGQTMFAGSIFNLAENTQYEVKLSLTDPDGGDSQRIVRMKTWTEPQLAHDAPTVEVHPGQLAEALAKARPGQVLRLHQGTYRDTFQPRSGAPGRPIGIVAAGDGEAILDGQGGSNVIDASGLHDVIFENLSFQNARWGIAVNGGSELVIRRCTIRDIDHGIVAQKNAERQHHILIADNQIIGRSTWPRSQGIEDRRGVQIAGTGNVVCYNRVRCFADAIDTFPSYPCSAIDIYGNEVSECTDDGFEMDDSEHNTRCFENRLTNVFQGISVQPVHGGPVYVFRNALYNVGLETFKMHNSPSGAIFYHNTSVKSDVPLILSTRDPVSNCVYRNNLFLGTASHYAYESNAPMNGCDFDYDGFGGRWDMFLKWNGVRYATMDAAAHDAPVYRHAVRVAPEKAFSSGVKPPEDSKTQFEPAVNDLRLAAGSEAVDAGAVLSNLNDGYQGRAPDLGAYELGSPLPHYGPRPAR